MSGRISKGYKFSVRLMGFSFSTSRVSKDRLCKMYSLSGASGRRKGLVKCLLYSHLLLGMGGIAAAVVAQRPKEHFGNPLWK